jgi:SAM-dependent methyltransferase
MNAVPKLEPLSWRDPDGFVVNVEGRILRAVAPEKADEMRMLLRAPWLKHMVDGGLIPRTVEISDPPRSDRGTDWLWLQHEALCFPCYPHEITALQLYDAAALTLKVAIEAARNGWILKDASAWNVLFSGGRPVFVDVLSLERRNPTTTAWLAYGQFARHFLLPLLLHRELGVSTAELFLTHRDGVTPEQAFRSLRGLQLISPTALELVTLPKLLSRAGARLVASQSAPETHYVSAELSGHLMLRTLTRLQRRLRRLEPDPSRSISEWRDYEEERSHYSAADLEAKRHFVRRNLQDCGTVLDLGCNAGEFSLLAAEIGKTVVAADADHPALCRLYARTRGSTAAITPILLQIGRPTPAVGWLNREVGSFMERSAGKFDCVLMLGLIHHLLISERATLPMIADLLDRLNPKQFILEWVSPSDPKFQQLAGLNGELYRHLDIDDLDCCLRPKFRLIERLHLSSGSRILFLWSR